MSKIYAEIWLNFTIKSEAHINFKGGLGMKWYKTLKQNG